MAFRNDRKSLRVQSTCVEVKFRAPHAIDAMLSLLDFHTAVDKALPQELLLLLELRARQFIRRALLQLLGDLPRLLEVRLSFRARRRFLPGSLGLGVRLVLGLLALLLELARERLGVLAPLPVWKSNLGHPRP
jgi:hypothetical protein